MKHTPGNGGVSDEHWKKYYGQSPVLPSDEFERGFAEGLKEGKLTAWRETAQLTADQEAMNAELEVSQALNYMQAEALADAAVYIRRMAKIIEGYNHPSGIHRRAVAFADQRLRGYERPVTTKAGEQ